MGHCLILEDGTELSGAGTDGVHLKSVSLEQHLNSGTDLTVGSVCSDCLTVTLLTQDGQKPPIQAGAKLQLYRTESAARTLLGTFWAATVEHSSHLVYKITAYDAASLLDKDLTTWLYNVKDWPLTITQLARRTAKQCGVSVNASLPNPDFSVAQFCPGQVTGRQLMSWIAEACGLYCHANEKGTLCFDWYHNNIDLTLTPGGGDHEAAYIQGGLSYAEYSCAAVERVILRQSDSDMGVAWPKYDGTSKNSYIIQGNPLLAANKEDDLLPIAKTVYFRLYDMLYTPCKAVLFPGSGIALGDKLTAVDRAGNKITMLVMSLSTSAGRQTAECTGNAQRECSAALHSNIEKKLLGRTYEMQMSIEGLESKAADAEGNITKIMQQAGQVSVKAESDQGVLETVIASDGTWKSQFTDVNGNVLSGIYFDFVEHKFKFKGEGEFSGQLNIGNGAFTVSSDGSLQTKGSANMQALTLWAGEIGSSRNMKMTESGVTLRDKKGNAQACLGMSKDDKSPYGYLQLCGDNGLVLRAYAQGFWLGTNPGDLDYGSSFMASNKTYGIYFARDGTSKINLVQGTSVKELYTGDTIAVFG